LDIWNDLLLHEKLPRLFTFAKKSKDLSGFLSTIDLASHFHLPLSEQSYEEYQERRETKYSNWTGRQRSMTIHSRIKKIHNQQLLQVSSQRNTTIKTFLIDLEIRMLQQIDSFLMVTPNGQNQH
jgi:hypothetical protein